MNYYSSLFQKINKKTAKIGIIGLGYVGLPLTLQFSKKKFEVLGFDIDIEKINLLNNNKSYIKHISSKIIKRNRKNLTFTSSFNQISKVDIIILCLPTPLTLNLKPDLSYIKKTMLKIKRYLENGKLIILESSTYPGSTKDLILPFLKKFKVGHNFFVGYSPEREDPNNKKYNLENIPKICSGYSTYCKKLTSHLYKKILKKVKNVTDINVAEFVKLYENIYRGDWYYKSWKNKKALSGGLLVNIAIHFFDILFWIFGEINNFKILKKSKSKVVGILKLQKASVKWTVSIKNINQNNNNLKNRFHRIMKVNNKIINFDKFDNLHLANYRQIMNGNFHISNFKSVIKFLPKLK